MVEVVQHDKSMWAAYLIGALLVLALKWGSYCFNGSRSGKTMKQCSLEWFLDPTISNVASWIGTIGITWVIGAIYIDGLIWDWFSWVKVFPVHEGVAFLLGGIMEMVAPAGMKLIASKIPFAEWQTILK